MNVIVFIRGGDRFFFVFDNENLPEILRRFGQHAADPDLNFTWKDAGELSVVACNLCRQQQR